MREPGEGNEAAGRGIGGVDAGGSLCKDAEGEGSEDAPVCVKFRLVR